MTDEERYILLSAAIYSPFILFSSLVCSRKLGSARITAETKTSKVVKKRSQSSKHLRSSRITCKTQGSEKHDKSSSLPSQRRQGSDKNRSKSAKTQTDGPASVENINKSPRTALENSSDNNNTKKQQQNSKKVTTNQDNAFLTIAGLDEHTTMKQPPPNQYETDAGLKKMVVDPMLVLKRGNIDNMYSKTKAEFISKLREAELPSDEDLDQQPALSKDVKIRFNDKKCVLYEINDEPTIDDMDEMGQDLESDIY